jgi:hypothetical protein
VYDPRLRFAAAQGYRAPRAKKRHESGSFLPLIPSAMRLGSTWIDVTVRL